jgi:glycine cleavage system aminomethyltransferase T
VSARVRHPLHPNVRRSPYFERTERAGAVEYIVYNHMYMPLDYGRDPEQDYRALTERVTLWDVGAERQTELRGKGALDLADYLCTRDLSELAVGGCRFTMVCDPQGLIMTEPIVLRPWNDVVWISHGDVDLTLWARGIAFAGGYEVDVSEPPVAPVQLQGPRSLDVVRDVAPEAAELEFYRCRPTRIAGVEAVVSRTGWSGELGYEIFPLDEHEALRVWDALVSAGEPHGLLITGPNLSRAIEKAITDTHYAVNSGMNPFEAGAARLVELDTGTFIGREALVRAREKGVLRKTLGLVGRGEAFPRLEAFWSVENGRALGEVRWAAWSYALERPVAIALLDASVEVGDRVRIRHQGGTSEVEVVELPFV